MSHDDPGDGYPLAYYLGLLLSFHLNQPSHDPIFITIDIKSKNGSIQKFPQEVDSYLREFFNENLIFKPGMLFKDRNLSLCESVIRFGWPEVNDMKGKFIFCLSGTSSWKNFYANTAIRSRLCFSDMDIDDNDNNPFVPLRGNIVVFNMHIYSDDFSTWENTLPLYMNKNLITRVYEANKKSLWNKALNASASIIATNEISGKPWAKVGNTAFVTRRFV